MLDRLKLLFITTAVAGLAGCGGGGGAAPTPPAPAPCAAAAPSIVTQPAPAAVTAGQTATFTTSAIGSPLAYQWLREGVAINGATAASYTTAATVVTDSGAHLSVQVSNCAGQVTSTAATLTVSTGGTAAPQPARISAGFGYSLALRADGHVLAWGSGMAGGTGTQIAGTAASVVNGISGVAAVLADGETLTPNSIAIRSDGQVHAWGYSNVNAAIINAPTLQAALSPAVSIARCTEQNLVNTPYLVLRANGTVWLGGTQEVAGLSSVVAITKHSELAVAGSCRPLAVKSDGSLWAVGFSYGSTAVQLTQIAGLPAVSAVSCAGGFGHNCLALSTDGHVWAWGDNKYGQLGDGTLTARTIPYQIAGLSNIRQIDIATQGAAAITADKRLYTWGGATGRPSTEDFRVPGLIGGWFDVESVSVGPTHWLVLRTDGSVWGWGDNSQGELGDGTAGNTRLTPVQATGINLN